MYMKPNLNVFIFKVKQKFDELISQNKSEINNYSEQEEYSAHFI